MLLLLSLWEGIAAPETSAAAIPKCPSFPPVCKGETLCRHHYQHCSPHHHPCHPLFVTFRRFILIANVVPAVLRSICTCCVSRNKTIFLFVTSQSPLLRTSLLLTLLFVSLVGCLSWCVCLFSIPLFFHWVEQCVRTFHQVTNGNLARVLAHRYCCCWCICHTGQSFLITL